MGKKSSRVIKAPKEFAYRETKQPEPQPGRIDLKEARRTISEAMKAMRPKFRGAK